MDSSKVPNIDSGISSTRYSASSTPELKNEITANYYTKSEINYSAAALVSGTIDAREKIVFSSSAPATTKFWSETTSEDIPKYPFYWIYSSASSAWYSQGFTSEINLTPGVSSVYLSPGIVEKNRIIANVTAVMFCGNTANSIVVRNTIFSNNTSTVTLATLTKSTTGNLWERLATNINYNLSSNNLLNIAVNASNGTPATDAVASVSIHWAYLR